MFNEYPKIRVSTALANTKNQSDLAEKLGYHKSYISQLVNSDDPYLPELAAYRYITVFGKSRAA